MWLSGQNTGWEAGDLVLIPNIKSYGITRKLSYFSGVIFLFVKEKMKGENAWGHPSIPGVTLQSQGHLPIPPTILSSMVRGGLTGKLIKPHILCKSQAVSLSVVLWVSWNRNRRRRETKIGVFRSLPKLLDATSLLACFVHHSPAWTYSYNPHPSSDT